MGDAIGRVSLVYFVSTLSAGGAQVGMVRLLDGLDRDRYDVTVVSVLSKENDLKADVPGWVRVVDLEAVSAVRKPLALYRTVVEADVLVCSLFHATLVGRLLGAIVRTPVVVNWHHSERFSNRWRERAYLATARLSDRILADSPAVADVLVSEYGLGRKVRTVPIAGVDSSAFSPRRHESADELRVATIGSLIPPKKQIRVLETARVLGARRDSPDVSFTIAGTGELEDELRERRDAWGLESVEFAGFVDDVPAFLEEHDVYLHTSDYEGLCIAALEAMAAGLPVVSTRVGGLATYVEDGRSGYLLDESDPETIADALCRLTDPDRRREFGRRGREIVEASYSQDTLVMSFESAIDECLDGTTVERVEPVSRHR
ncbi:glycosyltransferase [Halovivax gelatinilyticus]|uniref:glycosyltransferase n=1 Tax=Halovivax gelatinilyticus TaxID=2961597 RepID=UPI0020CA2DE8|nr:glycosyltransferase [Halovivax gelatinilyticus]